MSAICESTTPTGTITINVGGRLFSTIQSTLTSHSTFFATLLSDRWTDNTCKIDGHLFVDADPNLFEHILNCLRRLVPPVFWTRTNGFDYPLCAALPHEAQYFGITALEQWIAEKKYLNCVAIRQSIEIVDLHNCLEDNLGIFRDDTEKNFDSWEYVSNGRSEWKRVIVRKMAFTAPDSL